MAHLSTMMQGFHPWKMNSTVFQKTVAVNDYYLRGPKSEYPLGSIQSQGRKGHFRRRKALRLLQQLDKTKSVAKTNWRKVRTALPYGRKHAR